MNTDHEAIMRWAEVRGAKPAAVRDTDGSDAPGIIRLDFPGYAGADRLEHISWDDWFKKFDESKLALLYQEQTADGQESNFNKLVSRETAEEIEQGKRSRGSARRGTGTTRTRAASKDGASAKGAKTAQRRGAAAAKQSTHTGATHPTGTSRAKAGAKSGAKAHATGRSAQKGRTGTARTKQTGRVAKTTKGRATTSSRSRTRPGGGSSRQAKR